jgi:two-component system, cell cycle sensor histidine kinase and response regulator CckA
MGPSDASGAAGGPAPAAVIYVVDDSPDLAEMLELVLQGAGFPTRVFCEPRLAVEALRAATAKPRLLVTDFQMPGMNGMELIQNCRTLHPDLKVISASGHPPDPQNAGYPSKPDRVLSKPYTTRQLLEFVKELLAG